MIGILGMPAGLCTGREPSGAALPYVYAAAVLVYPNVAHMANVQGVVRVKDLSDGHGVNRTEIENKDANSVLGRAARENAQTWKFASGGAVVFAVTYHYILVSRLDEIKSSALNSKVVLRFPTDVEIYAQRWPDSGDVHVKIRK